MLHSLCSWSRIVKYMRSSLFPAAKTLKFTVLWDLTTCNVTDINIRFGGKWYIHLHAASASTCKSTWRPENVRYNFGYSPSSSLLFHTQLNSLGLSVLHKKHITSPLQFQQVNTIYITRTILDIVHRPVFYLKHNVSEA
jgi:hypothetical protein